MRGEGRSKTRRVELAPPQSLWPDCPRRDRTCPVFPVGSTAHPEKYM